MLVFTMGDSTDVNREQAPSDIVHIAVFPTVMNTPTRLYQKGQMKLQ